MGRAFHLWATIRQPAGVDGFVVTVTAMPEGEGDVRVELFNADTLEIAESIRDAKLKAWGREISARNDRVIDVVDD